MDFHPILTHNLILGVHQRDQLGLLFGELLLANHEVALPVRQLPLHVGQALKGGGQLVALFGSHRLAATAAANTHHPGGLSVALRNMNAQK